MPRRVFSIAPTYAVEYLHYDAFERSTTNAPLCCPNPDCALYDQKQHLIESGICPLCNTILQRKKPPKRTDTRQMSKESRKKLMNAIQWLKLFSPLHRVYCKQLKKMINFKLNFITLTLSAPQMHSDEFIKKHMLMPFLKWMARQGANSYVWKAEAQNNGNIHFHITTNHYLYWKSVRNKWNSLQDNFGYIKEFMKHHDHNDPNSTDIHAVRSDQDIGRYMGKYFGKLEYWCKEKSTKIPKEHMAHPSRYIDSAITNKKAIPVIKRQIDGRKWSMSNNLAHIRCLVTENEPNYMDNTSEFIKAQQYEHINADFADIWYYPHILDSKAPPAIMTKLKQLQTRVRAHDD